MAKCLNCGMSTTVRGQVNLSDGEICIPCFKEFGFRSTEAGKMKDFSFFEIKDGAEQFDLKTTAK